MVVHAIGMDPNVENLAIAPCSASSCERHGFIERGKPTATHGAHLASRRVRRRRGARARDHRRFDRARPRGGARRARLCCSRRAPAPEPDASMLGQQVASGHVAVGAGAAGSSSLRPAAAALRSRRCYRSRARRGGIERTSRQLSSNSAVREALLGERPAARSTTVRGLCAPSCPPVAAGSSLARARRLARRLERPSRALLGPRSDARSVLPMPACAASAQLSARTRRSAGRAISRPSCCTLPRSRALSADGALGLGRATQTGALRELIRGNDADAGDRAHRRPRDLRGAREELARFLRDERLFRDLPLCRSRLQRRSMDVHPLRAGRTSGAISPGHAPQCSCASSSGSTPERQDGRTRVKKNDGEARRRARRAPATGKPRCPYTKNR